MACSPPSASCRAPPSLPAPCPQVPSVLPQNRKQLQMSPVSDSSLDNVTALGLTPDLSPLSDVTTAAIALATPITPQPVVDSVQPDDPAESADAVDALTQWLTDPTAGSPPSEPLPPPPQKLETSAPLLPYMDPTDVIDTVEPEPDVNHVELFGALEDIMDVDGEGMAFHGDEAFVTANTENVMGISAGPSALDEAHALGRLPTPGAMASALETDDVVKGRAVQGPVNGTIDNLVGKVARDVDTAAAGGAMLCKPETTVVAAFGVEAGFAKVVMKDAERRAPKRRAVDRVLGRAVERAVNGSPEEKEESGTPSKRFKEAVSEADGEQSEDSSKDAAGGKEAVAPARKHRRAAAAASDKVDAALVRKKGSGGTEREASAERNMPVKEKCSRCGAMAKNTPMMRKGPDGCRSLCNACGLKWSRHGKC